MLRAVRILVVVLAAVVAAALVPAQKVAADVEPATRLTAAAPSTTTLLVRIERGASRAAVHARTGLEVVNRIGPLGIDVVAVQPGGLRAALRAYRAMPEVQYAEPNAVVTLSATPNDPLVDDQYALPRTKTPKAWNRYAQLWRPRGGARIAIIDSGIDLLHPEFSGKVTHCRSWTSGIGITTPTCQDLQVHGTHVAGIAAAMADNDQGIAGVAYDAEIMALQAFNTSGTALTADIVSAIVYAADNAADVANYSFGGATPSKSQRDAVRYASARGVVQIAAAGNEGDADSDEVPGVDFPAKMRKVIAVSATDARDRLASFSSYGGRVDVAAPGDQILSTLPGGQYGTLSGTSMAAPHVAGLAALLRAQGYSAAQTRRRILDGADDLGRDGRDRRFGHGRINVNRSLR